MRQIMKLLLTTAVLGAAGTLMAPASRAALPSVAQAPIIIPETKATGFAPKTPEQRTAHRQVELMQERLKTLLQANASPHEIGDAKADVQRARVEANRHDVSQLIAEGRGESHIPLFLFLR